MGLLIYRGTIGTTSKDPKAKSILIAAMAKFLEILATTAKVTINMSLKPPIKVRFVRPTGAKEERDVNFIDDELFKELIEAKGFEIEANVEPGSQVNFAYNEEKHFGNSMDYELVTDFFEPIDWDRPGFVGSLHKVAGRTGMQVGQSKMNRLYDLFEKVFSRYLGPTMVKSLEKIKLRNIEPDSIYINIFGHIVKLRP